MLTDVLDYIWRRPLKILYFGGPSLLGYGFWTGRNTEDICAELTQVTSTHWLQGGVEECSRLLEHHFDAFYIGSNALIVFGGLLTVICMCLCHCFFVRPITRAIIEVKK
jgi:hypothetical protein